MIMREALEKKTDEELLIIQEYLQEVLAEIEEEFARRK
jgi:hypothetical protein